MGVDVVVVVVVGSVVLIEVFVVVLIAILTLACPQLITTVMRTCFASINALWVRTTKN